MQTLSDFMAAWVPIMRAQMREIADKVEAGQDMRHYLRLEPESRGVVDGLVREYAIALSVPKENLTPELGYLLHLRLQEAVVYAQFLDDHGFDDVARDASDWIEFLAIDSWHEVLRYRWHTDFEDWYARRFGPA